MDGGQIYIACLWAVAGAEEALISFSKGFFVLVAALLASDAVHGDELDMQVRHALALNYQTDAVGLKSFAQQISHLARSEQ